ncbi:ABC transporter ATP-binding protein [Desulfospira joergensenii]|uniref:ABC transporter ATP-binding protein n=1 Tax=Desulfospira joergensenii TaxID=53329 RepID=UPI0003B37882|nr:energy-coupling factor transporter ATPase [Desulfospira joergensenii]
MDKAIELTHVSFRYKASQTPALEDISFSLNPGKCALIRGPSGSGKTTLCRCLNGLIPQALEGELSGDILVAGKDVTRFRVQTLARDIGFVMQDPEVQIVGRTVFEDLAFGPRNFLVPAKEIAPKISKALARVGLEGYENRSCAALSGGEKQRLAIAGILIMEPSVLILDEPASELDPAGRAEIYHHLNTLCRSRGTTLVIVEQNMTDIRSMVDWVLVMEKGRIKEQGRPEKIAAGREKDPFFPAPLQKVDGRAGAGASPPVLEIKDLNFAYDPQKPILKDVHLTLPQNEFLALMGHNGAGKTSLAKHLNGLIPCDPGVIFFQGRDITTMESRDLARSVGFVFQNPDHQIFETTVEKEIGFGLSGRKLSGQDIARQVDETLDLTGLGPVRSLHPFTLGKGTRQMIAMASILILRPRVLVMDEPFTGLDPGGSAQVMDLITKLHSRGTAIVLITHDLNLAARYARRLTVVDRGEIVLDEPMEFALENQDILAHAGLVPKDNSHDRGRKS